jgi:uncharacterized protein YndB with AHSA1/START domain
MSDVAPFEHRREFDAPRDLVWAVHTEPEHLVKWFGPVGAEVLKAEIDLRPGGQFHYGLKMPDGGEMWGLQSYREVNGPVSLAYLQSFSDPDRGLTRHPLSDRWPLETLCTLHFEKLDGGRTRLNLTFVPHDAKDEDVATFDGARDQIRAGFDGMLDALEQYLASLQ